MTKYFAISEHGSTQDHFEISNKQTGRLKTTFEKSISSMYLVLE